MKRLLRRLGAVLCALALLLPASVPASAADLYFVAVNDVILDLTGDTMPIWLGGTLYIPTTVLESSYTGVNLGVYVSNNRAEGFVLLYNSNASLSFDIAAGTCTDREQNSYPYTAIIRNGRTYLPLAFVTSYFGLSFSMMSTNYVPLLRITNGAQKLSDAQFLMAAESPMKSRYDRYLLSIAPKPDPPPVTPPQPTAPTQPTTPEPEEDREDAVLTVRLAIRCTDAETLEAALNALDGRSVYALFLLDPSLPAAQPELMRHLVGAGHRVGFYLAQESDMAALEEANRQLFAAARTETRITGSGDEAVRRALAAEGWAVWQSGASVTGSNANAVYQNASSALDRTRSASLHLELSGGAVPAALPRLLTKLAGDAFLVAPVTEF